MEALKESKQALVSDMLTRVAEWTSPTVLTRGVKFALKLHLTHMMITNIRGPAETLYCMAAPMTEVYPAPELWTDQSLAIGVLSYGQHLHLGFVANRENMGDLDDFVDAFETELAEIREIVPPPAPPRQKVAEKLREKVAT
jgi:diacylglycerol O-acyltransferase